MWDLIVSVPDHAHLFTFHKRSSADWRFEGRQCKQVCCLRVSYRANGLP